MTVGWTGSSVVWDAVTARAGPVRVLHVDDDPAFADLTATLLEQAGDGLEVTTAGDVDAALDLLAVQRFDCIVSDYDMPGRNGIEFLETIRESGDDVPFILFTGKGSEEIASRAVSAGVDDYLQKETGTEQYTVLANRIGNYVETARVEAQRTQLLAAIETAQEGVAILDAGGRFVYVNEEFAELYGYAPETLVGASWETLCPDTDLAVRAGVFEGLAATGGWHGNGLGIRADGETFFGHYAVSGTGTGGFVWTVRDITDRRAHERELLQYERLVETMADAVAALDADGTLTQVNDRMVALTGYDRERLVGSHASLYLDEADVAKGEAVIRDLLERGAEAGRYEVTIRRADGTTTRCEIRQTLLPAEDGRIRGSVGTLRELPTG